MRHTHAHHQARRPAGRRRRLRGTESEHRSAKGKVGSLVRLRFTVRDASPTVRVDLVVVAGGKALANLSLPTATADGSLRTKTWRVPASARGKKLRVCAAALDRAGNVSSRSCARLTVT